MSEESLWLEGLVTVEADEDLPLEHVAPSRDLKVGTRVQLKEMPHDPAPIAPGTLGTVTEIKKFDPPTPASHSVWDKDGKPVKTNIPGPDIVMQVQVDWDDGRKLALLIPKDEYEVIDDGDR